MNDLISRQAAIDALLELVEARRTWRSTEDSRKEISGIDASMCAIHDLPSAQPEIIRCKDSKHKPIATRADEGILWGFSVEFPDERCPLQCEDGWYNHYPKDDFYCANAERRTDE